jgi:hypothetical protein
MRGRKEGMFRKREIYCLPPSPNTTEVIKWGTVRWEDGYVASMGDNRMHAKFWLGSMHGKGHSRDLVFLELEYFNGPYINNTSGNEMA